MADLRSMTVSESAGKMLTGEHADVVREAVRLAQRNGYRQRQWDTRVGSLELAIPRLRSGS